MEHPSSYIPAAMWYNYSSYNDLLNRPRQLETLVNHVPPSNPAPMLPPPAHSQMPEPHHSMPHHHAALQMTETLPKVKKIRKRENWDGKPRNFRCNLCDAAFHTQYKLNTHMRIHSGIRPYVCDICGRSFIQGSNLKAHKRIHTGERPYSCEECGKTFRMSSHLTGHKRIHTGEKPYICGYCNEGFYTSSYLRMHIRRHTGEKPYECEYCGEAFAQTLELRVHRRIHTGEMPYKCRECKIDYVSAKELRSHRKQYHLGSKPYRCQICDKRFRSPTFYTKHENKCKGPKEKKPKGRPRKKRKPGHEPKERKAPTRKNKKKVVASTDRVSRSQLRAIKIEEAIKEEPEADIPYEGSEQSKEGININEIVKELGIEGFTKEALEEIPNEIIQTIPKESFTEELLKDLLAKQDLQKISISQNESSAQQFNEGSKIPMVSIPNQSVVSHEQTSLQSQSDSHEQTSIQSDQVLPHQQYSQHHHQQQVLPEHHQPLVNEHSLHQQPLSTHQQIIPAHQQIISAQHDISGNQQLVTLQASTATQQTISLQQQLPITMSAHQSPYITAISASPQLGYETSQPYVVDLSNPPININSVVNSNNSHFSRS